MLPCSCGQPVQYFDLDFSSRAIQGYIIPRDCKPFFFAGVICLATSLLIIPFVNPGLSLLPQSQSLQSCAVSLLKYFPSDNSLSKSFYLIEKNHDLSPGTCSFSYKCKTKEVFQNFTTGSGFPRK